MVGWGGGVRRVFCRAIGPYLEGGRSTKRKQEAKARAGNRGRGSPRQPGPPESPAQGSTRFWTKIELKSGLYCDENGTKWPQKGVNLDRNRTTSA